MRISRRIAPASIDCSVSERIFRPSRTNSASESVVELHVEKPTAGGRMLARHNGQVVLVWGAIPGERVRARIERSGKGVLFAETVEVVAPSPDRRPGLADWRCGGNVLAHATYERQLQIKSDIIRDAFARIGRLPLESSPVVIASPEAGYRMRARLHVRNRRVGFMREGSHEICAVGPTQQLMPATVAWVEGVETRLREGALKGMTSIEVAENIAATERAAHLELEPGADARAFAALATDAITGLSAQVLDRRGVMTIAGVSTVSDSIGTLTLKRDVRAFFQGNRFLLETLVRHVTNLAPDNGPVVDLYAGVGLFGLSLAAAGRSDITLVEGDPISAHDLEENARPFVGRARVERSSVEDFLRRRTAASAATVIVDPPRTGMSQDAVQSLLGVTPARLLYVSCDVATLARDVRALVDHGYALEQICAFDLFPNTAHVETVCLLRREVEGR
jgi:23S rRNA (uracil1939-C5)-methyltransferase